MPSIRPAEFSCNTEQILLLKPLGQLAIGQRAVTCSNAKCRDAQGANQVGVPLNRYRNSLRLARFWERLRKPVQPTIMQAVCDAGFGSYAQFYKVFFEAYGQGPRAVISSHPKPVFSSSEGRKKQGSFINAGLRAD